MLVSGDVSCRCRPLSGPGVVASIPYHATPILVPVGIEVKPFARSPWRYGLDLWRGAVGRIHMLSDPRFEFFKIDGRQLAEVWPQLNRFADVGVCDFRLGLLSIPIDQDAYAAWQAGRDWDLIRAKQRHVEPAELARGERRELGVKIGRRAEDRAGHIFSLDIVTPDHEGQQLPRTA